MQHCLGVSEAGVGGMASCLLDELDFDAMRPVYDERQSGSATLLLLQVRFERSFSLIGLTCAFASMLFASHCRRSRGLLLDLRYQGHVRKRGCVNAARAFLAVAESLKQPQRCQS